jgi:formyltetrahydrofolate deformylase
MNATPDTARSYILTVACAGARGIVAALGGFLAERAFFITEMAQFDDAAAGRYFSRIVFRADSAGAPELAAVREAFRPVAARFGMQWAMHNMADRARVLIMVSQADHCLQDLLYRTRTGELNMQVTAVVSNHATLRPLAERHGIDFHHLPVTQPTRRAQEATLMDIVTRSGSELVVLARYMQVLSDELCRRLAQRAINIHHSFLPGFKGARPYHQVYERGVKLIGATAHYVTDDLDEGPIIEQVVARIDHGYCPEQLVAAGRDSECAALARAVRLHIERRVFVTGNKTVVFQ